MEQDEELSTTLWIENHAHHNDKAVAPAALKTKKVILKDKTLAAITLTLKEETITWNTLITTAYTLLLHRFSTSNYIDLITLQGGISDGEITLKNTMKCFASHLSAELTIEAMQQAVHKHLKQKQTIAPHVEKRYGILEQVKLASIKSKTSTLTPTLALVLIHQEKPKKELSIAYQPKLFESEAIKNLTSHLNVLLLALCKNKPSKLVTKINILTTDERQKILGPWSSPYNEIYSGKKNSSVQEDVAAIAKTSPSKRAVKCGDMQLTYETLSRHSSNLATHLIKRGINVGDAVCVFMNRSPDLIIVMLAIFKAGAIFVPINPKYPADRIEFILQDTKTQFIIAEENTVLPGEHSHLSWVITPSLYQTPDAGVMLPLPNEERPAYIIYTSGTTGKPKGVILHHRGLNNLTFWYQHYFKITPNDVFSQFASQGFDSFFCETIPALSLGASIAIVDDNIKLTPNLFFAWLKSEGITVCDLPTAYAQFLFSLSWPRDIVLRLMKIGGEAMTHTPSTLFSFDIYNGYGPTEGTVESTYFKIYDSHSKTYYVDAKSSIPIGKPLVNVQVAVVDPYLMPCPIGVAGELLIGGAGLSSGYLNRLDLTENKFIQHPFLKKSDHKVYRTGDLVIWKPDGNLEFVGRTDNQIKIRGYRIELSDVENALGQHSDVGEVLVMAKETFSGEKTLVAYVVPNLDRERYLYQVRCLITDDDINFIEGITEDISRYGIAISGINQTFSTGQKLHIHLKLPGFNETKKLSARLVWQKEARAGFVFDLNESEQQFLSKSIDYFIANHNVMDLVLSSAAKRSLRRALQAQLPEYMIPTTFINLLSFPLTLNGKVDVKALPQPDMHAKSLDKKFIAAATPTEIKIATLWEAILNRAPISMNDNFFDIGGNSLLAAQLSMEITRLFDIALPANVLFELAYVPILAEYIDKQGMDVTNTSDVLTEINQDKVLAEAIRPTAHTSTKITPPENILLTGAGGYLGIFMLRDLLKHSNANIHCLIRQGDFETAAKRLTSTANKFLLDKEVNLTDKRIIAIPGDLSFEHFGLPSAQYQALAEKTDLILHCGAQVNVMASYQQLRGSNVQGTLEVLKFATLAQNKPLHYVSTLSSAYLKDAAGCLTEQFPTDTYENLFGGYGISKWVSEVLLRQAKERGLPTCIYRSGYIFGDSSTGILSLNDALLMLIKGCIQMGVAPLMQERVTLLPVDFVSRAINAIALTQGADSDVFHIDHPTGIMWTDLVGWLNEKGYRIHLMELSAWKKKLANITRDNALYPLLPYYLALPDDYRSLDVSTIKASTRLHELNLSYPAIDNTLLSLYLKHMQMVGFIPLPQKQQL
jgi:amino acid adenylation domain-containing protein/thioester reductase-like protein